MRILLVDDSRTIRNLQKSALANLGYTDIVEAGDGVEALQRIAETHPQLALIDWNMPKMDGITLVRTIRQQNKSMLLVMCTTEAEKSRIIEAIKAGVNNYVVKPFTSDILAAKLQATISKAGAVPA